jgi:parallel beta-helix repeat protein
VGVRIGPSMQLLRSNISYNGQMGVGGIGNDVLIESDTIAYNNTAHFSAGWEAGGTKFVQTNRLTVRGNFVHHNRGPGLWTDFENINTLYEGNRVEDNADVGIFHEISYAATIRNNVVARNGFSGYDWLYGAGILISASPDVEIYGNTVSENARGIAGIMQNRGSGAFGPFDLHNMYVHDNTVRMTVQAVDGNGVGNVTGIAQDVGDLSYFTSKNNRFVHNTYYLGSAGNYFAWMNGQMTESQWQEFGQDLTGTFIR